LNIGDLNTDLFGGSCRLVGEPLHFGGNHGKPLAGFSGAGRFDCRVQRKQVGLIRNVRNERHDLTDLVGRDGKPANIMLVF